MAVSALAWRQFAFGCLPCGEWFTGPEPAGPERGAFYSQVLGFYDPGRLDRQDLPWHRDHFWPFSSRHDPSWPGGPHEWVFIDIEEELAWQ